MEKYCKDCAYYKINIDHETAYCENEEILKFASKQNFYCSPDFHCKFFKRYVKSCPFCGADGVVVKNNSITYVTCRVCGARTSDCTQERLGVNIWNRRAKKED